MNIGSRSLKVIDFRLIEGTKITKLSHLRKKKNPLYRSCPLKVNCVISWLVRLFNEVKNIKIFVLASAFCQCCKNQRIEPVSHLVGCLDEGV